MTVYDDFKSNRSLDDLTNVERFFQVLTPLKQEPSSGLSSPMTLSAADLTSSGRKRSDIDFESFSDPKRRKTEKGGKGLRHFSMKVSRAHCTQFLL